MSKKGPQPAKKKGPKKRKDIEEEVEDTPEELDTKVLKLAELIADSKYTLVYTGAGISTAADIPDYRGPNGVYNQYAKGLEPKCASITDCDPTLSHLVLKELYRQGYNCDGLHLRSGMPQRSLSEIHGNMHIEVCTNCDNRQYIRPFDVTEKSGFRKHATDRFCVRCNNRLRDTIVHFGEHGRLPFPLNWRGTTEHIEDADLIIVIGSSLQVLKDYSMLWPESGSTTKIAIINLQWTPKDKHAVLKINARCDDVLSRLADFMQLPPAVYCRECDPVLAPRRSTRVNELMDKMTDCECHTRCPRFTIARIMQDDRETPKSADYIPKWWMVNADQGKASLRKDKKKVATEPVQDVIEEAVEGVIEGILDQLCPDCKPTSRKNSTIQAPIAPKRGRPTLLERAAREALKKKKEKEKETSSEESEGSDSEEGTGSEESTSEDEAYEPQYHQKPRKLVAAPIRQTRSSGRAEPQPLVNEFRKKRKDVGKARGPRKSVTVERTVKEGSIKEEICTTTKKKTIEVRYRMVDIIEIAETKEEVKKEELSVSCDEERRNTDSLSDGTSVSNLSYAELEERSRDRDATPPLVAGKNMLESVRKVTSKSAPTMPATTFTSRTLDEVIHTIATASSLPPPSNIPTISNNGPLYTLASGNYGDASSKPGSDPYLAGLNHYGRDPLLSQASMSTPKKREDPFHSLMSQTYSRVEKSQSPKPSTSVQYEDAFLAHSPQLASNKRRLDQYELNAYGQPCTTSNFAAYASARAGSVLSNSSSSSEYIPPKRPAAKRSRLQPDISRYLIDDSLPDYKRRPSKFQIPIEDGNEHETLSQALERLTKGSKQKTVKELLVAVREEIARARPLPTPPTGSSLPHPATINRPKKETKPRRSTFHEFYVSNVAPVYAEAHKKQQLQQRQLQLLEKMSKLPKNT